MHKISIIPVLLYCASPVETQNLASPVQQTHPPSAHYGYPSLYLPPRETQNLASHKRETHPSSAHYGYPSLYLPPRETQNFASLQGYATIIPSQSSLYNIAVQPSRDAKSCVSRATNTPTVSTLSLPLLAKTFS